jgi:hypothetical protein
MPTKTLCPKCHGQRTITCPVCSGSGGTCFAGVVVGICGQCHGAANVAATFAAVQQRLSPRHFNDGAPSTTPLDENCASPGRRLLRRTVSELRLQGCDPRQIEPECRPN